MILAAVGTARLGSALLDVSLQNTGLLAMVYAVTTALLVILLLPHLGFPAKRRVRYALTLAAAGIGALLGALLVWLVVYVKDVFGVDADAVIWGAMLGGGAAALLALANLIVGRWWRRILGSLLLPLSLIAAFLMVNRDVAYYPTLADALGLNPTHALTIPTQAISPTPTPGVTGKPASAPHASASPVTIKPVTLAGWQPPANMPKTGTVGTVSIPGVESHFRARDAWVYLPPAAQVKNPPRLPVVIAMAGQPGSPSDVFEVGNLAAVLNQIAATHRGLAPIVVVPDQLGGYNVNPMCVNSKMGNVQTYITVDVRAWILKNLPVATNRTAWTAAGFSEGATCAVQFGTAFPAIFGSYIAVSPELGPIDGSLSRTLREAFNGNERAWAAAQPIAIMTRHGHYGATTAIYSVGQDDTRYGSDAPRLAAVSRAVGMHVTYTALDGLAHNWNTGAAGLRVGLYDLLPLWGIAG